MDTCKKNDFKKVLGKISSAEFGTIPDRPYLLGLLLTFKLGDGGGVGDGGRYTENISKSCVFVTQTREEALSAMVDKTADILKAAKVNYISELVNLPVEIMLDGNCFNDFRILTEVL